MSYWTDGKGDDRVLYVTPGYRLVALNAQTGAPIASFGNNGIVDLKVGVVYGNRQPIDLETGEIGLHSTPTVAKDVVLVGSSFKEGMQVATHNNTKGIARAFDVRTGKLLWAFNTIPRPGEFGNDTWENDSWAVNGNAGVWTQITVDEEAGLVYLPVEDRRPPISTAGIGPGNNLFADTLVCVDLKTGIAQVALPGRAPSDLGLRPVLGAAAGRHHRRTAGPSKRSRCRARSRSSMCSIASPDSRCGRSRNARCRRATCPARRPRRRSRSRQSRRPTRGRPSRPTN